MVEAVRRVVKNLRGDLAPCLGCTDQMPRMIQNARPEYPQDAFLKNIQGIVEFDVLIEDAIGCDPLFATRTTRVSVTVRFSPAVLSATV